jgi:DHA3 family macrolide efflux protein-like MFS transporter
VATTWKKTFFALWAGQALSLVGSQVASFALVWWLTATTGSATLLATASIMAVAPGILLGPFAGALVDRWSRRAVMIVADAALALVAAAVMLLFWSGRMQVWFVYPITLARAIGGLFHWPAMQASTALMVPRSHLARIAGLNQALNGALNIIAPPLGALLLAYMPLYQIMGIDVLTAMFAVLPLLFISVPQPPRPERVRDERGAGELLQDVGDGLRYMLAWRGMVLLLAAAMLINVLIWPSMSLLPVLVRNHFRGGAMELGWIEAAWSAGMVGGGLALAAWGGFRRRIYTSLVGLLFMGAALLVTGVAPPGGLALAVGAIGLAGFMCTLANSPLTALLQAVVAPHMQGRVFTVMGSAANAAVPLGLAIAGPLADALGVQFWFVLGGAACMGLGTAGFFLRPLVQLEEEGLAVRHKMAAGSARVEPSGE